MTDLLRPGEVKKQYGYTRNTLSQFEALGYIQPERTSGGHRRYRAQDLERLKAGEFEKAAPIEAKDVNRGSGKYNEFGTTGLRRWGGTIYEERLTELRGREGRVLYREMRLNDPVIAAVFFVLSNALKIPEWRVSPASESAGDKAAAEFVQSCLDDLTWSWFDQLSFIIDPTLEQGFGLVEHVYKRRLGDSPPKYVENPAKSQHNDGRIGWRKFAPRPAESLAPGNEWKFDEAGGIQGVWQAPEVDWTGKSHVFVPIQKMLHFRTTVHPANTPEGMPIHRPMYVPYYFTRNIQEIEGIGIERNLAGLPVVYLGTDTSTSDDPDSDLTISQEIVSDLRTDEQGGVVFPYGKMGGGAAEGRGVLLELLKGGGTDFDVTKVLERYDKLKAVSMLAHFIMLGTSNTGSWALSRHQGDMFTLAAGAFLDNFVDVFNRHGIPRLMALNAFPKAKGMPKIETTKVGLPDIQVVSEYINKLVDKDLITPDDELERHLRQVADLPDKPEPEPGTVTDPSRRAAAVKKALKTLRETSLAFQTVTNMGVVSDQQANKVLRPMARQVMQGLGVETNGDDSGPDFAEQRRAAETLNATSQGIERFINTKVFNMRLARQSLLNNGHITEDMFIEAELLDGRMPDGTSVLSLFGSNDPDLQALLLPDVVNPADILGNDPAAMLVQITAAKQDNDELFAQSEDDDEQRARIMIANAALAALQDEYERLLVQEALPEAQNAAAQGAT